MQGYSVGKIFKNLSSLTFVEVNDNFYYTFFAINVSLRLQPTCDKPRETRSLHYFYVNTPPLFRVLGAIKCSIPLPFINQ